MSNAPARPSYRQIKSELSRLCADARTRPILVVDEAHHLRPDVLEDLRLLTPANQEMAQSSRNTARQRTGNTRR